MADREGFEPWVGLHAQRFSRPPRSTTPAPVRINCLLIAFFHAPQLRVFHLESIESHFHNTHILGLERKSHRAEHKVNQALE